jgi:hypothetical protein
MREKEGRDRFARAGEIAVWSKNAMASDTNTRIFAPGRGKFAKLPKIPSTFANLLEAVFYDFGKNPRMPSPSSKMLELLFIIIIGIFSLFLLLVRTVGLRIDSPRGPCGSHETRKSHRVSGPCVVLRGQRSCW